MLLILKRLFTKLFWSIPINNNKIFFTSYEGKQYSCNPKAIYEYMKKMNDKKEYIWEYNSDEIPEEIKDDTRIVKHNSLPYFYHLLTSKCIITNSGISASISLRKKQICINTWHGGGAYKKVGTAIDQRVNGTSVKELKMIAQQTSGFISSSRAFTELMVESTLVEKQKFLEFGMPRNDIFFSNERIGMAISRVKKYLEVKDGFSYVLFAPTYRGIAGNGDYETLTPNIKNLVDSLEKRFGGKWKVLLRSHYYKSEKTANHLVDTIDVTDYPDIQDLLCFASILITDYSSSIWDFSLTYKPCFLYVPDLNNYINNRGGFYTDIKTWPGIISQNDNELSKNIEFYNQDEYNNRILKHHAELGCFDKGDATKRLIEYINVQTFVNSQGG